MSDQTEVPVIQTGLRRNAIGLPGAVIMSAAIMGPAVSTFFNPQFSFPFSGAGTPFVYLVCLIAILIAASGVISMAARLPSAGAFYTYVTRGLGARSGFVTGGLMFVAYALLPPAEIGLIGSYLQSTFQAQFHVNIPWWIIGLAPFLLMTWLAFHGIAASIRVALVLFSAEVLVVFGMSLIVVFRVAGNGLTLHPLLPSASPNGLHGLVTGAVFAALSFVGFEGASTLSEEVREPRRIVPKAVLIAVAAVGILYVFCIWAEVNGLGVAATNAMTGSATPWNALATKFAPWMTWFIVVASVSSMFAVMVNSNNGIIRILHAMGREKLMPSFFGHVDPKRKTPTKAVLVQSVFAIVLTLLVGWVSGGLRQPAGGSNVYGYLGYLLTLGILPVYILTNIASIRFLRRSGDFKFFYHVFLPALGALLMAGLLLGQIIENNTAPYKFFPWVIVAWVIGVGGIAYWLGKTRPTEMAIAGAVMASADDEFSVEYNEAVPPEFR
ncbi:MAG: APC family permease [Acidimicrobiales bacterium]